MAVVLLFVGAGAVATDTAGKFSGFSPEGIAEPAMAVATGGELPVTLGESLPAPNLLPLSLKGGAEFATVVATGGEPPVLFTGPEIFWASARGAAEGAAKVVDGSASRVSCLAAGSVASAALSVGGEAASAGEPK